MSGVAGVAASVNGQPIPLLRGGACWETDWMAVGQAEVAPDDWRLHEVIPDTGEVRTIAAHPLGCNALAAGGGRWMAFGPDQALRSNFGVEGAGRYPLAMSDHGWAVVVEKYHDGGPIGIYDANGLLRYALGVTLNFLTGAYVRDGVLSISQRGVGWRLLFAATGIDVPIVRRPDVSWLVPVRDGTGQLWILERHDEIGLTLRQPDSLTAYVVVPGPSQSLFNPDVRWIA